MKLRVLGCAGSEAPGRNPPGFLLDDTVLLDAGSVGAVLSQAQLEGITHILLTHAHLDHVRGIPLLADNLLISGREEAIVVTGASATLDALQQHLFNGVIWPDFSRLPTAEHPVLLYRTIEPGQAFFLGPYAVTAYPVEHAVPAVAYRVERDGLVLVYTGDMGPTPRLWSACGAPDALIIEVSFPNHLEAFAHTTGHLTPALLARELTSLPSLPRQIFINHIKPYYEEQIRREIAALGIPQLSILYDGQELLLGN